MTLTEARVPNEPPEPDPHWAEHYGRIIDAIGGPPEPPRGSSEPEGDLFRRWTPAELEDALTDFQWTIKGCMAHPTFGQIAGELKTLKSYFANCLLLAVAHGEPLFDRFHVERQGPVLLYCGEGGRDPLTRRLVRICDSMGVRFTDTPMEVIVQTAPLSSMVFRESFERDLTDLQPVLTVIDPLYAYHGAETSASNLHEEGALLTAVTDQATEAGSNLFFVNHFNQTGSGKGLKRITMAGSGEHVDSWYLLNHREIPNVAEGRFQLRLEIGSRQWGGTSWDLDITLGRFNNETGTHDGDIAWDCRPANHNAEQRDHEAADALAEQEVIRVLEDHDPWTLTKTQLVEKVGGNSTRAKAAIGRLEDAGTLQWEQAIAPEGAEGTMKRRTRAGLRTAEPEAF